jgi:betaine-aldehyde dehydrogenase
LPIQHRALTAPSGTPGNDDSVLRLVNPADGQAFADLSLEDDVYGAVDTARRALPAWAALTPGERAGYLFALADAIDAHADELVALETFNVGKPISAMRFEIAPTSDALRFFAGIARSAHGLEAGIYAPGSMSYVLREPVGVVGLIAPWNYPLLEGVYKIAPALAAGNTAVIKPSELTPLTTIRLGQIAERILPPGVLNVVVGDGRVGRALVEHPDIALVSLTGDVSTGMKVAGSAAGGLKRVHLELGGKAPVLVCDDADIDAAVRDLVVAGFENTGQICTAPCRLIVADTIYERFVESYLQRVQTLVVGDPAAENTEMGPLVAQRQLDRVEAMVQRALADGAVQRCGGGRLDLPGFFYAPTVLTDVQQSWEIIQKEVFGPVVTIQRAATDDQMLEWANGVGYALAAGVWTNSLARAQTFAAQLEFGTVWINQHQGTVTEMPFGGFKNSGYGKTLSGVSLDEYSQLKHVMVRPKP